MKTIQTGTHEIEDTAVARHVIELIKSGQRDGLYLKVDDRLKEAMNARQSLVLCVVRHDPHRKRPKQFNIEAMRDAILPLFTWRELMSEFLKGVEFKERLQNEFEKARREAMLHVVDEAEKLPPGLWEYATKLTTGKTAGRAAYVDATRGGLKLINSPAHAAQPLKRMSQVSQEGS